MLQWASRAVAQPQGEPRPVRQDHRGSVTNKVCLYSFPHYELAKTYEDRFQSVTDRFLADLQHIHAASKETEPRLEQLIRGMRCILIRVFPMEAFEEAAEFMESLSGIFEATQSSRLRCALAVTMNQIISPIALVCSLPLMNGMEADG